ncbi:hypothetical protein D3C76_1462010 [compost metagenome]
MLTQHRAQRQLGVPFATGVHGHEHRGFIEPTAQPHTDHTEYAAQQKRIAPGVIKYFRRAERLCQQSRGQCADQVAERQPCLQEAQSITPMTGGSMLGHEHPGTRHFTAHCGPLEHPQQQ